VKIALIGANGQLGSDLVKAAKSSEDLKVIPLTHQDIEISDFPQSQELLKRLNPELLINTAAFHQVDICEDEVEASFRVNAKGLRNLSLICRDMDIPLVHMSTDYVFDGLKGKPYVEDDPPRPINLYGISKLAGEMIIQYLWHKHYIIRVSGLYGIAGSGGKGGNFIELMIRLAEEGRDIRVVDDQVLTPTYTREAAEKILQLIQSGQYGLYHMTNRGECSWYDFAQEIFRLTGLKPNLSPTTSQAFGAKAKRPKYSVLDNRNLRLLGLEDLRDWHQALSDYLQERKSRCQGNSKS